MHARFNPLACKEHHSTGHCRHTGCIAYSLHTRFAISRLVTAIIIYIIGERFALFVFSRNTAPYRSFAMIVFAKILRIWQYGLKELQRNNLCTIIFNLVYTGHAYILYNTQVCKVFLSESHPETGTLNGWEVLHQALKLLMVKQV